VHKCRRLSNRNPPADRSSKGDIFEDVAFPEEFVLKGETGRKRRRSSGPPTPRAREKRGVKRQSSPRGQASRPKMRRGFGRLSNGQFLLLSLVVVLILFSLWSRFS